MKLWEKLFVKYRKESSKEKSPTNKIESSTMTLDCPLCDKKFIIGKDSILVTDEDVIEMLSKSGAIGIIGTQTRKPELAMFKGNLTKDQKLKELKKINEIKGDLQNARVRSWKCEKCKDEPKANEYPKPIISKHNTKKIKQKKKIVVDNKNISDVGNLPEVYCKLVGIGFNSLGIKQQISNESIKIVKNYQTMRRPGALSGSDDNLTFPQYKISEGKIFRVCVIYEDMKLGMVIPRMQQYSADNFMQEIYLIIQRLAEFPIIGFCMSLPYLATNHPTKEGLFSSETIVNIYKGIDNMLFEIYEELGDGEYITGISILQKVSKVLGVTFDLPKNQLDKINKLIM